MRGPAVALLALLAGAALAGAVGAAAAPRKPRHRLVARIVHRAAHAPPAAYAPQNALGGSVTTVAAGQVPEDPASDPGPAPTTGTSTTTTTTTTVTTTTTTTTTALPRRVGITENDQGALTLKTSAVTIAAGPVTFVVANAGADPHDFTIEDPDGHTVGAPVLLDSKKGASVAVTLPPGRYRLYCSLFNGAHAAAGMQRFVTAR